MATIKGHTGIISLYVGTDYKPIACLTSTSLQRVTEVSERVNYCTLGETVSTVDRINTTISLEGEFVDDADKTSYDALITAMETKDEQFFKIEGRGDVQYAKGIISDLSDTYAADGYATFSMSVTVNGGIVSTDPKGS